MPEVSQDTLHATHVLEFPYTRSLGPVLGRFMNGLRERRIEGIRAEDGSVIVPPVEYDPVSAGELDEFVEVGQAGEVVTWTWVANPNAAKHPLDRPFAWALIRLDGADTPMLHAVDASGPDAMSTGMRVQVRWADETTACIGDIACFEPAETASGTAAVDATPGRDADEEDVTVLVSPMRLEYDYTPGIAQTRFLRALAEKRIIGQRSADGSDVYVPSRGSDPGTGRPTDSEVEVSDQGTVLTFCVVNVPFAGQEVEVPYVEASILLDGADMPFMHLLQEVEAADVHSGMRVEAVWAPDDEIGPTWDSIPYFRPSSAPDADPESYADHM